MIRTIDKNKNIEKEKFLNYIYTLMCQNPDKQINETIIFNELNKWGIVRDKVEFTDNKLKKMYGEDQFKLNDKDMPRLVFLVKKEELSKIAETISEYLKENYIKFNINYASKGEINTLTVKIEKETFENTEKMNKMLDYFFSKECIKNGLYPSNPFIPSFGNIGIVNQNLTRYYLDISRVIHNFLEQERSLQSNDISFKLFQDFVKDNLYVSEYKEIYDASCEGQEEKKQEEKKQEVELKNNKDLSNPSLKRGDTVVFNPIRPKKEVVLSDQQKNMLFFDALKETEKKFGIIQVKGAIKEYLLNNEPSYFSNGTTTLHYRELIKKYVSRKDMLNIIFKALSISNSPVLLLNDIELMVDEFCNIFFEDKLIRILDESSMVTLDTQGEKHLRMALNAMARDRRIDGFTEYREGSNINYRKMLRSFDEGSLYETFKKSLTLKGIDTSKLNYGQIVDVYSTCIQQARYASIDKTSSMQK